MNGRVILLLAAAVMAIAIGVAALVQGGDDGTGGVGPEAVAEAAERTGRVEGLRYTMTGETEAPQVGTIRITGAGVTDVKGQRGSATMEMPGMAERLEDMGEEGAATDPDNWTLKMFFDSRFVYMHFPIATEDAGKPWTKFDVLKTSEALGIDPALIRASQQQGDPTMTLRNLRTVSDEVELMGTETVRGMESTHYKATIDLRRYAGIVPSPDREKARRSVDKLIEFNGGNETSDMEVWVGKDRLVRRMRWNQTMRMPGQSQVMKSTYTMEFTDFDAKVSIEPPDEDEVRDVTDFVTSQLAAQSGAP
jgi:hypothetical protein